jgi:hypothetical protein
LTPPELFKLMNEKYNELPEHKKVCQCVNCFL